MPEVVHKWKICESDDAYNFGLIVFIICFINFLSGIGFVVKSEKYSTNKKVVVTQILE